MQTRFYYCVIYHYNEDDSETYDAMVEASSPARAYKIFYDHMKSSVGLHDTIISETQMYLMPLIMKGEERLLAWGLYPFDPKQKTVHRNSFDCIRVTKDQVIEVDDTLPS